MTTSTYVPNLVIHKLTKAQYEALPTKSATELYYITDGEGKLVLLNQAGVQVEFDGTSDLDITGGLYYASYASNFQAGGNIESVLNAKEVKLTSANAGTGITITRDADDKVTITCSKVTSWGEIEGTLADQTDLQDALDLKATVASVTAVSTRVTTAETNITNLQDTVGDSTKGLVKQVADNSTSITNLSTNKADKATSLSGYGITDAYTKTETDAQISAERTETATIENKTIDATDNTISNISATNLSASAIEISSTETQATAKLVSATKAQEIATTAASTKETKLTSANAGSGITITRDENDVVTISNTNSAAVWGNITGTLSDQDDLQDALDAKLAIVDIVNNVTTTTTNQALSANMGKELQDQIDNLKSIGRFLSNWNCATGLPATNPTTSPYAYHTGDYFYVATIAGSGATNYRPEGSSYTTGVASTAVESSAVAVGDFYIYDGSKWVLLQNTTKSVAFSQITGQPSDNTNLASALNAKVDGNSEITGGTHTKITYDSKGLVTGGTDLSASDIPDISATYVLTTTKVNNKPLSSDITLSASDVSALANTTKYGADLNLSGSSLQLKDQDGNTIGNAVTLPDTVYTAGDGLALSGNQFSADVGSGIKIDSTSKKIVADTDVIQSKLSTTQMTAVDSGISATKVGNYDDHIANTTIHVTASDKSTWSGKQDALSETQLAAVNSGINTTKVGNYDTHIADSTIHITSAERTRWNSVTGKAIKLEKDATDGHTLYLKDEDETTLSTVVTEDTTYSAGIGLTLTGTSFAVNTDTIATKASVDTLSSSLAETQAVVGDSTTGLVKDVNDLKADPVTKTYTDTELAKKQNSLTAGDGISIATDPETNLLTISNTSQAIWGNITGTLANQTDLQTALDNKENKVKQWATNTAYELMDLVLWDSKLFLCTTAHTSLTAFDRSKFNNISALSDKVGTWHSQTFTSGTEATTLTFTLSYHCDSVGDLFVFEAGRVSIPRTQLSLDSTGYIVTVVEDFPVAAGTIFDINWIEFTSQVGLHSPYMTGIPTAPTAASTTDTDQIATTAFVHDLFEDEDIEILGGSGNDW